MKRIVTAGTTFSVALGIGFVMQYGDALASRVGVDEPIAGPETQSHDAEQQLAMVTEKSASGPFVPRKSELIPINLAALTGQQMDPVTPLMSVPTADDAVASARPEAPQMSPKATPGMQAVPATPIASCTPKMTAEARPLAMVHLTLSDTCAPNSLVTIHHQGMMFNTITDSTGQLRVDVPALARDALFIADFKTGEGAAASIVVPDLDSYDRAVLQWQGEDGVELHALEFGAGYDDDGHVWAAAAGSKDAVMSGTGGVLTELGNASVSDGLRAEVYTYPSGQTARDGNVVLNVEAEITARNCGRDIAAQSIQVAPGQRAKAIDLTMTMPGCDAVGEFLVLKNMFTDLTLAAK